MSYSRSANPELAMTPVLEALRKGPLIAFYQGPRTPVSAPVKTWAGLGKVIKLLAPTCASRLTRMRPGADPRGAAARIRPIGPRVEGVMHHEAIPLLKYRTVVPRPSFAPALVGFTSSATVLIGVMLLLSSVAQ